MTRTLLLAGYFLFGVVWAETFGLQAIWGAVGILGGGWLANRHGPWVRKANSTDHGGGDG